ncbi:hypothetical protein [Pseudophaeobacter flagellatus]|uniref:hypothetical protein n=1 Tax=Pseudophaeobacter flagellatus TaxID=2899119 RepID=UPI001E2B4294|nr:hypothetical protein [Pseudophaeobacter flagellatus]MCD9149275.1 hypothetical protein [Pseudophaeobacter flagellatus]
MNKIQKCAQATMRMPLLKSMAFLISLASPIMAQEEINNGTNPVKLTSQIAFQYQFNQINSSLNTGLLEMAYTKPFGDGSQSFRFTLPFSDSPFNAHPLISGTAGIAATNPSVGEELRLGDISLMLIKVFGVTEKNGAAATFELFLDTAETETAGYGQFAAEASAYYAWFLDNGSIFAPALVHTFGLEGGNSRGVDVNTTTIDFYYVPKLNNPKYYITADPAIIHDWETDATFGSLQVTFGMMTGKAFGGDSQIFIKPGVMFGGDAPADWSVQVGYKVLNF